MADAVGGPTVLRLLLGAQLRRLREARGISAHDAAQAIRGSESKISRIELGRNAVREIDIADLLTLYGITDKAEREQLLSLASRANQPGWWHRYRDVLPPWFQAYIGLEESAHSIRSYDVQFVPGLLQTEEYAAAVLALGDFSSMRWAAWSCCAKSASAALPQAGFTCGRSSMRSHCAVPSAARTFCAANLSICWPPGASPG
jgi:transcriptional regulator with XRE-family HTH domain